MNRVLKVWNATESVLIGLLLIVALGISLFDMFARIIAPKWVTGFSEELVVYIVVWALFIAVSKLTYENAHVRADMVVQMLPRTGRRIAEIICCLIGLAFAVTMLYFSYLAAFEAWEYGDLSTSTLRMPLWIFYTCLPFGFLLVVLRYLIKLWLLCFKFTPALLERRGSELQ